MALHPIFQMAAAAIASGSQNLVDLSFLDDGVSSTGLDLTLTVKNNGEVDEVGSSGTATNDWYTAGAASGRGDDYEVRLTVDSGDAPESGDSTGAWLALTSNRSWTWGFADGGDSATVTLEIRRASTGTVQASSTFSVFLIVI